MEYKDAGIPYDLIYSVSKLSSKRNRVFYNPTTSQTMYSGGTGLTTFVISDPVVIDPSTVSIAGLWKLKAGSTSANAINYVNPCASDLYSQCILSLSGVQVSGQMNSYQHISQRAYYVAQTDASYQNSHCLEGLNGMYLPPSQNGNISSIGGSIAAGVSGDASLTSGIWLSLNNISCLRTNRLVDLSIFGKFALQLKSSGVNVVKGNDIGARNCSWQLENLEMGVDVIAELPPAYIELIKTLVAEKKQFKVNFSNEIAGYNTFQTNTLLNASTQSLDGFMVVPVVSATAYTEDANQNVPPCFRFQWGSTATLGSSINFNFRVGAMSYPQSGSLRLLHNVAQTTQESLFGDSLYAKHSLYCDGVNSVGQPTYSQLGYAKLNGVFFSCLAMLRQAGWAHPEQTLSGIPTWGNEYIITVNMSPDAVATPANLLLVAQTTSTVVYDSVSGGVSVIQ